MARRIYQLSTCPVYVVDDHLHDPYPCGAEVSIEITIHEEGAEYGVWAEGTTECGHSLRDIAHDEQVILMGTEP